MGAKIEVEISAHARAYVRKWAKQNRITFDRALDEILMSVCRDAEGGEYGSAAQADHE